MNNSLIQKIERFSEQLDDFIDWCGRVVSWLVISMVLVTFFIVVMRYLFDSGWIALQESATYMHSFIFLVGAAYTLKHNEHVRVDILYEKLGEKAKSWIELFGHLIMLLPVMLFIIWVSYPYVKASWLIQESSQEAGGLPGVFILKTLILIMAILLIVQAFSLIVRAILNILGYQPRSGHDDTDNSDVSNTGASV